MVEEPDGNDKQEQDDGCDDHGYEGIDAFAGVVADFGVEGFGGGFLGFVRFFGVCFLFQLCGRGE